MKTKIFALALALFVAAPIFAQDAEDQPSKIDEQADRITERLTESLALSEDQREDVYDATVEMLEEQKEGEKSRGEIVEEYDDEMSKILNDEQYAQYMEGDERKSFMAVEEYKAKKKASGK